MLVEGKAPMLFTLAGDTVTKTKLVIHLLPAVCEGLRLNFLLLYSPDNIMFDEKL